MINRTAITLFIIILSLNFVLAESNETNVTSYKIIIYPDIQGYTYSNFNPLSKVTDWVINETPDYVLFVGDLVEYDIDEEWNRVVNITNKLQDNNVTYLIGAGDHDASIETYYPNRTKYIIDENRSLGIFALDVYYNQSDVDLITNLTSTYSNYSFIFVTHSFDVVESIINNYSNVLFVTAGHQNGEGIYIKGNYYYFLNGHGTQGIVREVVVYSNGSITSKQYSNEKNITYVFADLFNLTINYSITFIEDEPIPIAPSGSSGGGGGGSSSIHIKNITNITEQVISIVVPKNVTPEIIESKNETIIEQSAIKQSLWQILWNWILNLFGIIK